MTSEQGLPEVEAGVGVSAPELAEWAATGEVAGAGAGEGEAEPRSNPSRPVERTRGPSRGLPRTRDCAPSRSHPNSAGANRPSHHANSLRASRRGKRGARPIHQDEQGRRPRVRSMQVR